MRRKTEEKRQEIISAAASIFKQVGFEKASMSLISSQIGGSKATLYNYFPSKEKLFIEVVCQSANTYIFSILQALDLETTIEETLSRFSYAYLKMIVDPDLVSTYRTILSFRNTPEICKSFYETCPQKGWKNVEKVIEWAMKKGELRKADPWVASMHLKGLIESEILQPTLLYALPCLDEKAIKRYLDAALETFFRAYKSP